MCAYEVRDTVRRRALNLSRRRTAKPPVHLKIKALLSIRPLEAIRINRASENEQVIVAIIDIYLLIFILFLMLH